MGIDCVIGHFTPYSQCTKSCSGGSQRRTRNNIQPQFGGKACPHSAETRACNVEKCRPKVSCNPGGHVFFHPKDTPACCITASGMTLVQYDNSYRLHKSFRCRPNKTHQGCQCDPHPTKSGCQEIWHTNGKVYKINPHHCHWSWYKRARALLIPSMNELANC